MARVFLLRFFLADGLSAAGSHPDVPAASMMRREPGVWRRTVDQIRRPHAFKTVGPDDAEPIGIQESVQTESQLETLSDDHFHDMQEQSQSNTISAAPRSANFEHSDGDAQHQSNGNENTIQSPSQGKATSAIQVGDRHLSNNKLQLWKPPWTKKRQKAVKLAANYSGNSCMQELSDLEVASQTRLYDKGGHFNKIGFSKVSLPYEQQHFHEGLTLHDDPKFVWGDSSHKGQPTVTLAKLASLTKSGDMIFEFGTFRGINTYHMAENAPQGVRIFTLDMNQSVYDANLGKMKYPDYTLGEYYVAGPEKLRNKITQLVGDSTKINLERFYGSVQLAFVDGGHSKDVCLSDARNAVQMLKPGGYMIVDDVSGYWPGVPACMEELRSDPRMQEELSKGSILQTGRFGFGWFRKHC